MNDLNHSDVELAPTAQTTREPASDPFQVHDLAVIRAYADRRLDDASADLVECHVASCERCFAALVLARI